MPRIDLESLRSKGRTTLSESEAKTLLRENGIPTTEFLLPKREELSSLEIGFPMVVKVDSPKVLHKTEVGGVYTDIRDWEELVRRYDEIRERFPGAQVLVEPMEFGNAEFIVGVLKDPVFGMSIMFGMGGILTELYQDVTFRKIPIAPEDAEEMLDEVRGGEILRGFRGIRADKESMRRLLSMTSKMADHLRDQIHQIDLNPVIVKENGCVVVDAKVILEKELKEK